MAEPIDPDRWKDAASRQWRQRFDETARSDPSPAWTVRESSRPVSAGPVGLTTLLDAGAELSDAEIAYVVAATAGALADLHESGSCHGAVGLPAVEVGTAGQVTLGAARSLPGRVGSVADDAAGLAAIFSALTRDRPISAELAQARVTLAKASPTAADVTAVLRPLAATSLGRVVDQINEIESVGSKLATGVASVEPPVPGQPQRSVLPSPGMSPPISRREPAALPVAVPAANQHRGVVAQLRRPIALGVAAALGCALIWMVVGLSRGSDTAVAAGATHESVPTAPTARPPVPVPTDLPTPAAPTASGSAQAELPGGASVGDRAAGGAIATTDWIAALASLDEQRLAAFAAGDGDQLKAVNAAGSVAMTSDLDTVADLRRRNVKPVGLQTSVESVRALAQSPGSVTLEVADHRSGYELTDRATGVTQEKVPARGSQRWRVRLDHHDSGWLIAEVTAIPPGKPAK